MEDLKLAILIDADNISPKYVKVILDEGRDLRGCRLQAHLRRLVRRSAESWKDALLNNSIIPIQQYSYTTGKMRRIPL